MESCFAELFVFARQGGALTEKKRRRGSGEKGWGREFLSISYLVNDKTLSPEISNDKEACTPGTAVWIQ